MSHQQSCQVGDIFVEHLLAIYAGIRKRTITVELCRQFRGRLVIPGAVFGSPPIAKPSFSVIDVAQFIEAVADFMGNPGPGRPVVGGRIASAIEERWLQQRGGKELGIGTEHDNGARSLRMNGPLDGVDRFFQFRQIAGAKELFRPPQVTKRVAPDDIKSRIVNPSIGIANQHFQRPQLGQRFLPGRRRHPAETADPVVIGSD
jgi:hypothetical protein